VPLAPLGNVSPEELPAVIQQMDERILRDAPPGEVGELWTAAGVLMGLRYSRDVIALLLRGVHAMKESTFYQGILEEGEKLGEKKGEIRALQRTLLRLGRRRFGPPEGATEQGVQGITDQERLERMTERLLEAANWQELLATT
jgi:predicted transposase YdaD